MRIKSLTFTIITESQVALSNDQGTGGNYTPVKKMFYKDGLHLFSSVSTFTYELRKLLHNEFGWKLFDVVLNTDSGNKLKNMYNVQTEHESREADLFGYLIPSSQISRTAPLRVIPPISINPYHSDTQLITNRGFLNKGLGREYQKSNGEKFPGEPPTTQALASEEIMGDYYKYTVTVELDRIGRMETQKEDNNHIYLSPSDYEYKPADERKQIVMDLIEALTIFTRTIKHQTVFLEPLAVFGGLFERVVPYFSNSVNFVKNHLFSEEVINTVKNHKLEGTNLIQAVNSKIKVEGSNNFSSNPVGEILKIKDIIASKVEFDEENNWILKQ